MGRFLNTLRALIHTTFEQGQVMDHIPLQLPQPNWTALRDGARTRHGRPFRCDVIVDKATLAKHVSELGDGGCNAGGKGA